MNHLYIYCLYYPTFILIKIHNSFDFLLLLNGIHGDGPEGRNT